jgi:hypothetical protein
MPARQHRRACKFASIDGDRGEVPTEAGEGVGEVLSFNRSKTCRPMMWSILPNLE